MPHPAASFRCAVSVGPLPDNLGQLRRAVNPHDFSDFEDARYAGAGIATDRRSADWHKLVDSPGKRHATRHHWRDTCWTGRPSGGRGGRQRTTGTPPLTVDRWSPNAPNAGVGVMMPQTTPKKCRWTELSTTFVLLVKRIQIEPLHW